MADDEEVAYYICERHWLRMNVGRAIFGCHCGFEASDDDAGYGDSVIYHIVRETLRIRRATQ